MKRQLAAADILPPDDYERVRTAKRNAMIELKKKRRVSVGPYATFYFENYDTMWLQVQEMLRVEKGGAEQMEDELRAYNPLIPNGRELVATVMFEIEDPAQRAKVLGAIGGVEKTMFLKIAGELIAGKPEQDLDYTSEEGKASSVQFVHFPLTDAQIAKFRTPDTEVMLGMTHPHYGHMTIIALETRQELAKDFG